MFSYGDRWLYFQIVVVIIEDVFAIFWVIVGFYCTARYTDKVVGSSISRETRNVCVYCD